MHVLLVAIPIISVFHKQWNIGNWFEMNLKNGVIIFSFNLIEASKWAI